MDANKTVRNRKKKITTLEERLHAPFGRYIQADKPSSIRFKNLKEKIARAIRIIWYIIKYNFYNNYTQDTAYCSYTFTRILYPVYYYIIIIILIQFLFGTRRFLVFTIIFMCSSIYTSYFRRMRRYNTIGTYIYIIFNLEISTL